MKKLLFALLAVAVSPPLFAQASGTITSSQLVCIGVSAEHSTVGVQVTGTWTGTLQPQVAIQGQALTNSQVVPSTSTTPASTITTNGVYYANVGSASQFCILGNTVASGSAVVFLNVSKGVNASTLGGSGGSNGLSGLTAGQVPIAATATTATSSQPIQGSDASLLSSGTVAGTGAALCTDANGGATTSGCPALSGMSAGGVPLAATGSTVTSSTTPGTNQGTYVVGHTNTSNGVAVATSEIQQGDCTGGGASIAGTATYTVLYSDLLCTPTHALGDVTAVTVTIPTPTTLHNAAPKFAWVNLSNQVDTLSPTTFTISKGSAAATSTITVEAGYKAVCSLRPDSATIWECNYNPVGVSGATAGVYTAANITVDAFGRVTAAANGAGGGNPTVTSETANFTAAFGASPTVYEVTSTAAGQVRAALPNTIPASGQWISIVNHSAFTVTAYPGTTAANGAAMGTVLVGGNAALLIGPQTAATLYSDGANYAVQQSATVDRPGNRVHQFWHANGGNAFPLTAGTGIALNTVTSGGAGSTSGIQAASSTAPAYWSWTTGATNPSSEGYNGNGNAAWFFGENIIFQQQFNISATTTERFFTGLFNTGCGLIASATPNCNGYGFRVDTSAADTNFMACLFTSTGPANSCTSTGVAAATTNTSVEIQVYDNLPTPGASFSVNGKFTNFLTTDFPNSAGWEQDSEITTLTTAARTLGVSMTYVESDK